MSTVARDASTIHAAIAATAGDSAARRARRRTWICLSTAFLIWVSLAGAGLWAGLTYRRGATDSPGAALAIERGTVFYEGAAGAPQVRARPTQPVEEGGVVEAGENGRAILDLFDGTSVKLMANTRVELSAARIGKFNAEHTRLALTMPTGAAHFSVPGGLPYGRDVTVTTPHGTVSLNKGEYLIWVQEDGTRVSSYAGQAKVAVAENAVRLRDNQRATLPLDGFPRGPFPIFDNVIRNGDFSRQLQGWATLDKKEPGRDDVGGTRRLVEETIAGRKVQALRITRDTEKNTHNETGIVQELNRDVSAYRTVTLTAWVKVDNASLSGGGYLGSEYPLMFRVQYTDDRGGRPGWSRGFYYANPENRPTENGQLVTQGEWYPFLIRLSDLPDRPAFIKAIEVLAAGHDFDSMVADVRLVAE
jgi:hypothetical protein